MPEPTAVSFRTVTRIQKLIERLTDSAQSDMANCISCIQAATTSHRPGYMLDCAKEFRENATRKLELATEIASVLSERVTNSVDDRKVQEEQIKES